MSQPATEEPNGSSSSSPAKDPMAQFEKVLEAVEAAREMPPAKKTPAELEDILNGVMIYLVNSPMLEGVPPKVSFERLFELRDYVIDYMALHWSGFHHAFHEARKKLLSTVADVFLEIGEIAGETTLTVMENEKDPAGVVFQKDNPKFMINFVRFATGELHGKPALEDILKDDAMIDVLIKYAQVFGVIDAIHFAYCAFLEQQSHLKYEEMSDAERAKTPAPRFIFTDPETHKAITYLSGSRGKVGHLGYVQVQIQGIALLAAIRANRGKGDPEGIYAPKLPNYNENFWYDENGDRCIYDEIYALKYSKEFFERLDEINKIALRLYGFKI